MFLKKKLKEDREVMISRILNLELQKIHYIFFDKLAILHVKQDAMICVQIF